MTVAEIARRVNDLIQVFAAKGLVQRDGDTVVVRTIVVPPDELTKEWNELVSLVQELVRRRKCAQKDRALSSNKYPAYRVDLPCLNALLLDAEAAKVAEVVWDVDKTCEQLRSWYKGLPSFEEKVEIVCANLKADKVYAMLFIGPPGSGKTHMLLSLYEAIPTSAFLSGMALTPAGLEDLLLTGRVDVLLVDEIDKADVAVLQHFLPLAENNMLRIIKANKSAEVRIKKLIGTANVKRKVEVWKALQDRLMIIEFESPSAEELKEIVKREVPNVPEEFLQQVDLTRLSIRQAVMLASVATVNLNVALKLYQTLLKYSS